MKVKDLLNRLENVDPNLDVVVMDNNMETVSKANTASIENDVEDKMSGDEYGTCLVIDIN